MSSSTVDPADPVFQLHRGGKMAVVSTVPLTSRDDLSLAYTPGVARVCEAIAADPDLAHEYTWASRASRSSPTARPYSVSATSARAQRCR